LKDSSNYNLTEELFQSLSIPLYNFLYNILKNKHDAEDIVADTFVRILEIVYVDGKVPNKPLCFTIARNLAIDFLRRKKKVSYDSVAIEGMQITDDLDVFEEVNKMFEENDVDGLIKQLPEVYANIFYLRFYHDLSFKEIGDIMEFSENNARVMYFRARNKLKKILTTQKEGK